MNELNQCTSKGIMNELLSEGLLKPTGKNWISLMTTSGAKGSKVSFLYYFFFNKYFFFKYTLLLCSWFLQNNKPVVAFGSS